MFMNLRQNAVPILLRTGLGGIPKLRSNKLLLLDIGHVDRMALRRWIPSIVNLMKPMSQSLVRLLLGAMLLPVLWAALFAVSTIAFCFDLPHVRRSWLQARKQPSFKSDYRSSLPIQIS